MTQFMIQTFPGSRGVNFLRQWIAAENSDGQFPHPVSCRRPLGTPTKGGEEAGAGGIMAKLVGTASGP